MKKTQIMLFAGILVVCIAIFALALPQGMTSYAQNSTSGTLVNSPTADPHTFGLPAITRHLLQKDTAGAVFTSNDVTSYVNAHPVPGASPIGPKPVVTKIVFQSSLEVSKLLKGESTGFPDGAILCYVEFHGVFTFAGPKGKTVTYQTGYEVFDAQTGNIVMSGGM